MVVKSFPDSCYLNTSSKLTNLITTTTSSQTTTESTESFITTETTSITTFETTQDQTTTFLNPVLTTIKIGCNASTECIQSPIVLPNNISILTIGCVNQICTCLHPNATYVHTILACKINKDGSCTYTQECAYGTCNGQNKCTGNDPNG
ncbi:unnamed protein product [Brachionus calyciflorus]|uniref:Uncharacterized protein n=1 Tax=Brachionus calyciflorus TaxID=104777 RepID=A0A814QAM0_9BILA|nr:unnamed protein product [Brachionus calyciflorus]